jgi:hypothetical protein
LFLLLVGTKIHLLTLVAATPPSCRKYDFIQFRNGYATDAPEMLVEFRGLRCYGKGRNAYYAIQLGRILKIKRWRK